MQADESVGRALAIFTTGSRRMAAQGISSNQMRIGEASA